ncbi:MAG: hypothetical protein HOB73_13410 [Planctomycetaceae bacterium]|nr:hypothetical protein [Planctomycetaceae bacterium]
MAQHKTPSVPISNNKYVLLLRNGQTFTGAIVESTGPHPHYTLTDTLGNQLRFPKDQVEFISDSILEVYAYRRASQVRNNAPACLALAQWCMQLRLFIQAQEQIDKAIIISGRTVAISRLETRLDLLRSPPPGHRGQSFDNGTTTKVINADQVQKRIDQFPVGIVHQFVRSVQPLLINRCAVAGCHGPNPQSTFVLFRTSAKRATPHRISLRNLYNTLTTLDLIQPENSSLLTAATTAHGELNQPPLGFDASQEIANLVNWVRVVASAPTHNIDVAPLNRIIPQNPIIYQRDNTHRSEKMKTPDSAPQPPTLNPPVMPNKLQQWIQSKEPSETRSALGLGVVLPVEMLGPTLGMMKITPTSRVNLTPDIGGNFFLPSNRILQQNR